ncbi:MAG: hypothetical protein H6741_09450 [Alphaproteobacteria bacterium]|nr:hypothetical protein [Alphaproteobacteria bacterium]MCB9792939.1 hypothetical protein [Alphaproteobacteria bacterium]
MLLPLLLSAALATQVVYESRPCPLGDADVRVFSKVSANTHGGWDSDLASYSTKGQWREYALATCPDSLFTLYGSDMELSLSAEQREALAARLEDLKAQYKLSPEDIETWERYLIAGEMYKVLGKDPRFLSQLYLEASWVARDEAVGVYVGLEGPTAARDLLDAGAKELGKPLSAAERKVVLYNLLRVAHRGGFFEERDAYLAAFEAMPLDAEEREAAERFRRYALDVEPRLQRLAVKQLRAWLATEPEDPIEVARATYLLADLARRLGETEEAVRGYALVLSMATAPQELRELSAFLGSSLEAEK